MFKQTGANRDWLGESFSQAMLHRFVPPSERFTLFHLLPIRIYFMAKNTHGLGTCSELTGFIIKQKPHLAVSFLDTVMIFYYIHGLPTTEILLCRVQSISHRESLANLTALHMLLVPDPKQIRPCWKPQPSDFSSASHLSPSFHCTGNTHCPSLAWQLVS